MNTIINWKNGCFDWVRQIFGKSKSGDSYGTPLVSFDNINFDVMGHLGLPRNNTESGPFMTQVRFLRVTPQSSSSAQPVSYADVPFIDDHDDTATTAKNYSDKLPKGPLTLDTDVHYIGE